MTLIVTTLRPNEVLITADSRSITREAGQVVALRDDQQKIFPIPQRPLAILHHGENRFENRPVTDWLNEITQDARFAASSVEQATDLLRQLAYPIVRARLKSLLDSLAGCGLCVVGFDNLAAQNSNRNPRMTELFWSFSAGIFRCEERRFSGVCVIPSGDGQTQIEPVSWKQIHQQPLPAVQQYQQRLFDQAASAVPPDAGVPNSVGGPLQQLLISPNGWEWTLPPASAMQQLL
ncbi:MAG: hypothetical protein SGJ20_13100 [Planctomycetota bacterium]|nr:hypothetical protein [Planctomycetota bacterium]